MIAVIASGGSGTRMRPATLFVNKHLLPVGEGRLMIDYPLSQLSSLGFQVVTVVTGCEHAGQVSEYVADGHSFGYERVDYVVQPKPAGIADVVLRVSHKLDQEGLLLILGDNFFSENQLAAIGQLDRTKASCFEYDLGAPEKAKAFGQVFLNAEEKLEIVEKPQNPTHSKILTGLYYFPADVVEKVKALSPSQRGELEITDLLKLYLAEDRLQVQRVTGTWHDLGEWASWTKFVSLSEIPLVPKSQAV